MRRGAIRAGVAALTAAAALGLAGQAIAGSAPDPRPGDKVLGTRGGITYVSDAEQVDNPAFADALAACPKAGGKSRITGGGIRVAGIPGDVEIKASRPLDLADFFGDDDTTNDDYWEASIAAPLDTPLTSYAICAKLKGLKYKSVTLPVQAGVQRSGSADCTGDRKVIGGGGFIATTDSRMTSMYPLAAGSWSIEAFDNNGGNGVTTLDFVCFKSKHLKTATAKRRIPAGTADFRTAKCAKGSHVTGGGARMSAGPLASSLVSSYPADGKDKDKVPDDGWTAVGDNEGAGPQKLSVFAICKR